MRVIGLTGGIASGKSTVGAMLRDLGAEVIDADQVARDVVAPGQPALAEIVRRFGHEMLRSDGTLDRKRLGAQVFEDDDARLKLNAIMHPAIGMETARRIADAAGRGLPLVVYEATLLVETGLHLGFDGLIVVSLPTEEQVARAVSRDGFSEEDARRRIAVQLPLPEKIAVADYVIDNSGKLEETRRQVCAAWRDILAGNPRRRSAESPATDGKKR